MPKSTIWIGIAALLLAVLLPQSAISQTTTPTPAPSKTATPIPTVTATATATPEPATETPEALDTQAFTQEDLTVLTGNVQRPNGIYWFDNQLYTACTGDWTVYQIEATTGATIAYIYGLRNAHTLYAEYDSQSALNLWAPDFERNVLTLINAGGIVTAADGLEGPWGIAYWDENSFLVTNLLGDSVVRVTRDGEVTSLLTDMRSPTGIVVDGEFIYIANNGSARRGIEWTTMDSDTTEPVQPLVGGLQNTTGIVMASDGYLYFAYSLGTRGVIGRVDPAVCRENGGCTNDEVEIVIYSELAAPLAGLTISPDMRLFVHTIFRPEIYWVQLGDTVSENAG